MMDDYVNIATQFDGTFDLEFLLPHERIRKATDGSGAVEITDGATGILRVEVGEWLIRTPSGKLIRRSELP